jgi:hypothetical protein
MKLPQELLQIIYEYADMKCRNGVYISQIGKTDPRRETVQKIKRIQQVDNTPRSFVILQKCLIVCFSDRYSNTSVDEYYVYSFNYHEINIDYYVNYSLGLIFDNVDNMKEYIINYKNICKNLNKIKID